ncbi:MAG: hypothetical protein KG003_06730 [Bacteroidetes bacterium]|nr:hypothetical protein [Bacteroidota bacterium]
MKIPGIVLLFLIAGQTSGVFASHIFGADITYKSLGGSKYRISANLYRDCRQQGISTPQSGVFAGTNGGNGCGTYNINFTRTSITEVSTICKGGKPMCSFPNAVVTTGYGIERQLYEADVDFSATPLSNFANKSSCCEVTFYIGDCCRIGAITTGASGDLYATCTIQICNLKKCTDTITNGPAASRVPPTYFCCNQSAYFNNGFMDTFENDSISYKLTQALNGLPQSSVIYSTPYSNKYPITPYCIPSSTIKCAPQPYIPFPRGLFFDTANGDFIFVPTNCTEVGVVNFEANEWRKDTSGKYLWIGKVHRDIVIRISNSCGNNNTVRLDSTYEYDFCAGDLLKIRLNLVDEAFAPYQSGPDSIFLSWNRGIPKGKFEIEYDKAQGKKHAVFTWQTKLQDTSDYKYHFVFSTTDSVCDHPTVTHRAVNIYLKKPDNLEINTTYINCNKTKLSATLSKSVNGNSIYTWIVVDSFTGNIVFKGTGTSTTTGILSKGTYKASLFCTNKTYCYQEIYTFFHIDSVAPTLSLPNDTNICYGKNVSILGNTANFYSPVHYHWTVNSATNSKDTLKILILSNIISNQAVSLMVSDARGCILRDDYNVNLFPASRAKWSKIPLDSICRNTPVFSLSEFVDSPADSLRRTGKFIIQSSSLTYGKFGIVDSIGANKFVLNPGKLTNDSDFNSAKTHTEILSLLWKDSFGCSSKSDNFIKILKSPELKIINKDICQNRGGEFNLDSLIIKPDWWGDKSKYWSVLSAPSGIPFSDVIKERDFNGIHQYWFQLGSKGLNKFAGKYALGLTVIDKDNDCAVTDNAIINLKPQPELTTNNISGQCVNLSYANLLQLFDSNGQPADSASSSFNIYSYNGITDSSLWKNIHLKNGYLFPYSSNYGNYQIQIKNWSTSCINTSLNTLQIYATPKVNFTTSPADSAPENLPYFTVSNKTSIASSDNLSYVWYYRYPNPVYKSTADAPTITYPNSYGIYTVLMIATSSKGCKDSAMRILQVGKKTNSIQDDIPEHTWFDGNFVLHGMEYEKLETMVFNAAGARVFSGLNNQPFNPVSGIYFYQIQATDMKGKVRIYKGKLLVP